MSEGKERAGAEKTSEIGGELGNKMIGAMSRFHPPYAKLIKETVATMQSSTVLNQRERDIVRLVALTAAFVALEAIDEHQAQQTERAR